MPVWPELLSTDTVAMARELIGWWMVVVTPEGLCGGPICETEAYTQADPASHSFRGQTPRNRAMFGPPGRLYVYRIYGIHWCCNLVTAAEGSGEAVLIRALQPELGVDLMRERRGLSPTDRRRTRGISDGPGKLCQALGIDGSRDAETVGLVRETAALQEVGAGRVCLVPRGGAAPAVVAGPRVGISKATGLPWRFRAALSSE